MTTLTPEDCRKGECEHADFPHTLVLTEPEKVNRWVYNKGIGSRITEERPAMVFAICLGCRHAIGLQNEKCRCPESCHTAEGVEGKVLYWVADPMLTSA